MKFFLVTAYYPEYLNGFYARNPEVPGLTYEEQRRKLYFDCFAWADFWSDALVSLGHELTEACINAESLQRTWARENKLDNPDNIDLRRIALEQVKRAKPEILWFNSSDTELLKQIRQEVPGIKLIFGWSGSAITNKTIWKDMDFVLSCAPESVIYFRNRGIDADHLNHGFSPIINERLVDRDKSIDFSFLGQLIRQNQFHVERDRILELLADEIGIDIFSPSANYSWQEKKFFFLQAAAFDCVQLLKAIGFSTALISKIPKVGKASDWDIRPLSPVNPKLKSSIRPPLFGLEMFQMLKDSKVALNIHADSSPEFASNMRLYEATGVGTCLITDWKKNLGELFEPDVEVATYRTAQECSEKVKWLLEHPEERESMARAGQQRVLKEHTVAHRAQQLVEIVRRKLS